MALVLLIGTLNRVMIVELGVPGLAGRADGLAAAAVRAVPRADRLPLRHPPLGAGLAARALHLDGHDAAVRRPGHHAVRAAGAVRRRPAARRWIGELGAALAFLLVGAGLHTTQTAGLALATDLAPRRRSPRVVALMYVMLLLGMVVSALVFGALLRRLQRRSRLIQVMQGAAVATMVLNVVALWKQEPRDRARAASATTPQRRRPSARPGARSCARPGDAARLVAVGLGTSAFSMQDMLLEPYGGQILHLPSARRRADRDAGARRPVRLRARRRGCSAAAPTRSAWPAIGALVGVAGLRRRDLRRAARFAAAVRASARC